MAENVLIVHGGGPTAVINSSLYGVIEEAKKIGKIDKVYAAIGGSEGILKARFLNLLEFPEEKLKLLLETPATAIGSSRYALEQEDYEAMVGIFKKHEIKYVLLNGGNGTMDTCGRIYEVCKDEDIRVVGIPKTIDNDIAITDHTPGFGSAARYIAATTAEVGVDVKSLPIHVCIIEAMGRNAGWITAASALARKKPGDAPHLIYLPERPFNEAEFLEDVKRLHEEKGGVVVVVSEGLKMKRVSPLFLQSLRRSGQPIMEMSVPIWPSWLLRNWESRREVRNRASAEGLRSHGSLQWTGMRRFWREARH